MPPPLPQGQRYVPVEPDVKPPAPTLPAPGSFASVPDPAPGAFPESSNTLDPPPPAYYPGAGPTVEGFLYQQLGKAMFPGDSAVWTGVQTWQLTDAGTGADSPSLRPTIAFYDHLTTATPVPGIGLAQTFRMQNTTPALVEVAKICPEITGTTPASEEGTLAFCVVHQGKMCESFRTRGQLGMAATVSSGGVYGFLGGQVWARGDLYAAAPGEGHVGFGVLPVFGQTVTISPEDVDDYGLVVQGSPTNNAGLFALRDDAGHYVFSVDQTGSLTIAPMNSGADCFTVLAPAGGTGTLFQFGQTGAGNALLISAPGGGSTFEVHGLGGGSYPCQVFGFPGDTTTPLQRWLTGANVAVMSVSPAAPTLALTLTDATTNTISDVLVLDHHTSGTPAAGWGHRIQFDGQSSTTQGRMMGLIETWWAVATDATRQSVMTFRVADAAADREFLRASTNGAAAEVGFLGAAAVVRQTNMTAANLAGVSDAAAKACLTALSDALVNFGLLAARA